MVHVRRNAVVQRFLRDESGATAIEYALIAAGIGATVASTIWSVGAGVKANLYDKLSNMF
jgi:pilus assembly protein Flp/PilA